MKILVDENIPAMTVSELRRRGHDILDFRGTEREGTFDSEVWNLAQKESRLLITTDKGFAQLRQSEHAGVLIIRLRQPNRHKIHQRYYTGHQSFQRNGLDRKDRNYARQNHGHYLKNGEDWHSIVLFRILE